MSAAVLAAPAGNPAKLPDPDQPGLSTSKRAAALLDRVQAEQKQLTSLEADFVQRRESEFLASPEESRGTFAYRAPDLVRWDYLAPSPLSLVIRDDEMLTWYKDLGKAERVKVGRASSQVLRYLNASGSLDSLMKYFTVTIAFPDGDEPYRLDLTPRYARIQKRLKGMTLWIARDSFLPVRVRYVEASGDLTEYRFEAMRRNREIPLEQFELEIPAGVEIQEVDLDRDRPAKQ
ncbi:MAG: outer membrane lipoprotein carrier protein LolA [Thermoanaerobaculia bacterium]